jgi:hypothetical protein
MLGMLLADNRGGFCWLRCLLAAGTASYLTTATAMAVAAGSRLLEPVVLDQPAVTWLFTGATNERLTALSSAGLPDLAYLMRDIQAMSSMLVLFATGLGIATAILGRRQPLIDPILLMAMTAASTILYAFFAGSSAALDWLFRLGLLAGRPGPAPALWLISMSAATVAIAWTAGLLIHDVMVMAIRARAETALRT